MICFWIGSNYVSEMNLIELNYRKLDNGERDYIIIDDLEAKEDIPDKLNYYSEKLKEQVRS